MRWPCSCWKSTTRHEQHPSSVTSQQFKLAAWVGSGPSFFVVLVLVPGLALANKGYVPEWVAFFCFMVFLMCVPVAFVGRLFGLLFAFQARLPWLVPLALFSVHVGAILFASYLVVHWASLFTGFNLQLH